MARQLRDHLRPWWATRHTAVESLGPTEGTDPVRSHASLDWFAQSAPTTMCLAGGTAAISEASAAAITPVD